MRRILGANPAGYDAGLLDWLTKECEQAGRRPWPPAPVVRLTTTPAGIGASAWLAVFVLQRVDPTRQSAPAPAHRGTGGSIAGDAPR